MGNRVLLWGKTMLDQIPVKCLDKGLVWYLPLLLVSSAKEDGNAGGAKGAYRLQGQTRLADT
jgi:hypothetical protein